MHVEQVKCRILMCVLASRNVRTLLDVEGPIETARLSDGVHVVDECKIRSLGVFGLGGDLLYIFYGIWSGAYSKFAGERLFAR